MLSISALLLAVSTIACIPSIASSPDLPASTAIEESSSDGRQSRQYWPIHRSNRINSPFFHPSYFPQHQLLLEDSAAEEVGEPAFRFFGLKNGLLKSPLNLGLKYKNCGSVVFANGTRWQTAAGDLSGTSCSLTIRLNGIGQSNSIAQIRLDFLSFSIAQPDTSSLCLTDRFDFYGAETKTNTICGDNDGQHMYLEVSPSANQVLLVFNFGQTSVSRSWDIKISLLPSGANYLAPSGCLQYFYGSEKGKFLTYNFKDFAVPSATRELANQDYNTCFRNEIINTPQGRKRANTNCYYACYPDVSNHTFLLSGPSDTNILRVGNTDCPNDFLIIPNTFVLGTTTPSYDRFCGNNPNIIENGLPASTFCSSVNNLRTYYKTNDNEDGDKNNPGYCIGYYQTFV